MARVAEIRFTKEGPRPRIEVTVPFGTSLAETVKLHELISRDLISKISPRGCTMCNSGVDIWIHEAFDDIINVDLQTLKVIR